MTRSAALWAWSPIGTLYSSSSLCSAAEYALKRTGFLKLKDKAEPDWDKFSNSVREKLLNVDGPTFRAAIRYLLDDRQRHR